MARARSARLLGSVSVPIRPGSKRNDREPTAGRGGCPPPKAFRLRPGRVSAASPLGRNARAAPRESKNAEPSDPVGRIREAWVGWKIRDEAGLLSRRDPSGEGTEP